MSVDVYHVEQLWQLEDEVRSRLEPMPAGGLQETTGACIDARAGHPDCLVLGVDGLRHVVRYQGSLHGEEIDLQIAFAADDPEGFLRFMSLDPATRDKVMAEIRDGIEEIGPKQNVHESCADMEATPETVGALAVFNRQHFRIARKILQGDLGEREYLHAGQGASLMSNSQLVEASSTALKRHKQRRVPVARLRDSVEPREALVINRTGRLLPPMEYNNDGTPKHHLVYDADDHLVVPVLAQVGQGVLSKKIKQRTLEVVSAGHQGVLADKKIRLPYDRIIVLE